MWVIKAKGESFYVEHVVCELPWSTKETPDNSHTKGSIKIKQCHLVIDDENTAHLKKLTPEIEHRLANPDTSVRVITSYYDELEEALDGIEHNGIMTTYGVCGESFHVVEIQNEEEYVLFKLQHLATYTDLRELKPNEEDFKAYEYFKIGEKYDPDEEIEQNEKSLIEKMTGWFT